MSVVLETTLGDLTIDLYVNERPHTCLNFLKLCKIKYYNLCLFHTVNSNFCAQTGDPSGKGDGGESIYGIINGIDKRFYQAETQPKIKHDRIGLISMVSHGGGLLGSQFMITLSPDLQSLDSEHCVFGHIVEGHDILRKLNETITDVQHRPYQDIRITHTVILEDPFPDPQDLISIPKSPQPTSAKDAAYSRIPADEPISETCSQQELDEMVQAREAAARATILEMVGDLPDAEVAPPENVLFVCKLNPVTTDRDLSIIFARFGKVKTCEVIRDSISGDSLQYAFVEFEDQKSCEDAYFKMDNVLIDGRRIHVDFSQSVAKWRGKGKGAEMLGPTPPGGWGNKGRGSVRENDKGQRRHEERRYHHDRENMDRQVITAKSLKTDSGASERMRNGSSNHKSTSNKIKVVEKKKRRRSSSSSSSASSSSLTSSTSSESSDDSPPPSKKRRRRKDRKILLVVRKSSGKSQKKLSKKSNKSRKYDSDSGEEVIKKKVRKTRRKSSSAESSSEEDYKVMKYKKRRGSSPHNSVILKKKKRKPPPSSSDESSEEEKPRRATKKKRKKVRHDSPSEDETRKKRKKNKIEFKKRQKKRKKKIESDGSSSD